MTSDKSILEEIEKIEYMEEYEREMEEAFLRAEKKEKNLVHKVKHNRKVIKKNLPKKILKLKEKKPDKEYIYSRESNKKGRICIKV